MPENQDVNAEQVAGKSGESQFARRLRLRGRSEWRRCYVCGRYISFADFNTPGATTSYDPTSIGDMEPRDPCYAHTKCEAGDSHA